MLSNKKNNGSKKGLNTKKKPNNNWNVLLITNTYIRKNIYNYSSTYQNKVDMSTNVVIHHRYKNDKLLITSPKCSS